MAVILRKESLALSTKDFSYSKGTFTAEDSDFKDVQFILQQRVYDDALDTGFVLENPDTGNRVRYVLHQTVYSPAPDRELMYWEYRPLWQDSRGNALLARTKVVILND